MLAQKSYCVTNLFIRSNLPIKYFIQINSAYRQFIIKIFFFAKLHGRTIFKYSCCEWRRRDVLKRNSVCKKFDNYVTFIFLFHLHGQGHTFFLFRREWDSRQPKKSTKEEKNQRVSKNKNRNTDDGKDRAAQQQPNDFERDHCYCVLLRAISV